MPNSGEAEDLASGATPDLVNGRTPDLVSGATLDLASGRAPAPDSGRAAAPTTGMTMGDGGAALGPQMVTGPLLLTPSKSWYQLKSANALHHQLHPLAIHQEIPQMTHRP